MNSETRYWMQEAKYQKAKRMAERCVKKVRRLNDQADRYLAKMQSAYDAQKKIMAEMGIDSEEAGE